MIATALALQSASKDAIYADVIVHDACDLAETYQSLSYEEFLNRLYTYSMNVSAMSATFTAEALLSEDELTELTYTLAEMQLMAQEIENEVA